MTGYQKIKHECIIHKDYAATLEEMLLKMGVPQQLIDEKKKERNSKLYELDHENR